MDVPRPKEPLKDVRSSKNTAASSKVAFKSNTLSVVDLPKQKEIQKIFIPPLELLNTNVKDVDKYIPGLLQPQAKVEKKIKKEAEQKVVSVVGGAEERRERKKVEVRLHGKEAPQHSITRIAPPRTSTSPPNTATPFTSTA